MIVTTENVQDRKACRTPAAYQEIAAKCLPFETWLNNNNNRAYAVDHTTKTLEGETPGSLFWVECWLSLTFSADADEGRANYWIYLHNFPCHHQLPDDAEMDALNVLQIMIARKYISTYYT